MAAALPPSFSHLARTVVVALLAGLLGALAVAPAEAAPADLGPVTDRITGKTRVATAVALSRFGFPEGASEVYLARADVFADAVAAGSLSGGPVLLVPACGVVPVEVRAEIERLDPERVVALGGPAAVCSDVLRQAGGGPELACTPGTVAALGAGTTASPLVSATLTDGRVFVATRGLVPATVAGYDPSTGDLTAPVHLPTGQGAWASTAVGEHDLYVGTYNPADLYHVDTATMTATRVADFPDATYIHGLATSPDGKVFIGTLPDGGVYEYDPATGASRALGAAYPGEYAVRSIAVTADVVYAGVGAQAHLMAIDRESGERHDILPPELSDQSFVYALEVSDQWLVAGTEPGGRVAVIDVEDPTRYQVLPDLGERTADAIAIDGDDVYFTGRTTGSVYHYEGETGAVRVLGVPLPREETRGLFLDGDVLVGTGGSGVVWRLDLVTGDIELRDLADSGVTGGAEPIQSIFGLDGTLYVGGHWGIQVHEGGGAPAWRLRIPGEPKAMAGVGGVLYTALYPSGELWRYHPGEAEPEHVATIGHEQIRPRDMAYDARSGLLLIASQAEYGLQGGALSVFDPASGDLTVHRDPVPDQSVRSVTGSGTVAYIGTELRSGGGTTPADGSARLAAWDLDDDRPLWDVAPVPGASAIVDVVAQHGTVYGLTAEGVLFALDPRTQTVMASTTLTGNGRALVPGDGALYGTWASGLYGIDLDTLAGARIAPGSGYAHLSTEADCSLYVARGRDVYSAAPGNGRLFSALAFGPTPPAAELDVDLDH